MILDLSKQIKVKSQQAGRSQNVELGARFARLGVQ